MSSPFKIVPCEGIGNPAQLAASATAATLAQLAEQGPRIQCITNPVAMDFTSDVLLAVGAQSSMALGQDEVAEFVASAASLSVNIGTLDTARRQAIAIAIDCAADYNKPWVLDPVSVHASKTRCDFALGLIERGPRVIRGNYAEIHALAGDEGPQAAQRLARRSGAVVVQSGPADMVTDGERTLLVANGDSLQTRVSAMGCASSALIAALLGVESDPYKAALHSVLLVGVAAEEAVMMAAGPGSFHMHFLDRLYRMDETTLQRRGRLLSCEQNGQPAL